MHVSASTGIKAHATGGPNQSQKRCSKSPGKARTYWYDSTEPLYDTDLIFSTVFRDQLYKHLETVPEGDFEGYYNKLVQAGSTLEFLKYADTLFEIFFTGGLLQPGGNYVQDTAPSSPFSILKAKDPAQIDDLKKYVDVLNKLIRR